jgi:hypothetical protein
MHAPCRAPLQRLVQAQLLQLILRLVYASPPSPPLVLLSAVLSSPSLRQQALCLSQLWGCATCTRYWRGQPAAARMLHGLALQDACNSRARCPGGLQPALAAGALAALAAERWPACAAPCGGAPAAPAHGQRPPAAPGRQAHPLPLRSLSCAGTVGTVAPRSFMALTSSSYVGLPPERGCVRWGCAADGSRVPHAVGLRRDMLRLSGAAMGSQGHGAATCCCCCCCCCSAGWSTARQDKVQGAAYSGRPLLPAASGPRMRGRGRLKAAALRWRGRSGRRACCCCCRHRCWSGWR